MPVPTVQLRWTRSAGAPSAPHTTRQLQAEIDAGQGRPLADVAKGVLGRGGRPVAFSTAWRWCAAGVRVPGGRVRLEAALGRDGLVTTDAALRRFLELRGAV